MKTLINSSEIGMLSHWTNLVRAEEGEKPLRMPEDCRDFWRVPKAGTYLIETQVNQMGAIRAYFPISAEKAEKFMAMPIEQAVKAMGREAFA
jgi:hypothetical protein